MCEIKCSSLTACSPYPNSVLWIENLLIYASKNSLVIYDFKKNKIKKIYNFLTEIVCLHGFKTASTIFIGIALFNGIIEMNFLNPEQNFIIDTGELVKIQILHVIQISQLVFLIIISCINGSLTFIQFNKANWLKISKTLINKYHLITAINNIFLDDSNYLILCALTSGDMCIYHICIDGIRFEINQIYILKCHDDWIKCIDVLYKNVVYILTCSQDETIKVWILQEPKSFLSKSAEKQIDGEIWIKSNLKLDTTLRGHKNWITSVKWCPPAILSSPQLHPSSNKLQFISASTDETIILWKYDDLSGEWLDQVHLGISKGFGFIEAIFNNYGNVITTHTVNGDLYSWQLLESSKSADFNAKDSCSETWQRILMPTNGHASSVNDIAWQVLRDPLSRDDTEPTRLCCSYLVSVSNDQTTRLFGTMETEKGKVFTEIARCQIHGYDLNCVTWIDPFTFASGAEEKVIRVFRCTRKFIKALYGWNNVQPSIEMAKQIQTLPTEASNNPLDLTNLNIRSEEVPPRWSYKEDILNQNTLWYGHGNEIYALAYNPHFELLASACKASKPEFANIYIWKCDKFKNGIYREGEEARVVKDDSYNNYDLILKIPPSQSHTLTVTRIKFNQDGRLMLSVSRDRSWKIYELNEKTRTYNLIDSSLALNGVRKEGSHNRIIWDCCWFPPTPNKGTSREDCNAQESFVTVSRDKKCVIWTPVVKDGAISWITNDKQMWTEKVPINCVDIALIEDVSYRSYIIALGLESGSIKLYTTSVMNDIPNGCCTYQTLFYTFTDTSHGLAVKRLNFATDEQNNEKKKEDLTLASCSADGGIQIHRICYPTRRQGRNYNQ